MCNFACFESIIGDNTSQPMPFVRLSVESRTELNLKALEYCLRLSPRSKQGTKYERKEGRVRHMFAH